MRLIGTGLQFRMGLGGHEPGMIGKLDHLHDPPVWRQSGQEQPVGGQDLPVIVIDLIPVSVALVDGLAAIECVSPGIMAEDAGFLRYFPHRFVPASGG